jgi:pimeloyl-ACP methyl ester carboxylesterase
MAASARLLSARGYRIAAMDVRGYGDSSRPLAVDAYSMLNLCRDVAAVVTALLDAPNSPASKPETQPLPSPDRIAASGHFVRSRLGSAHCLEYRRSVS